MIRRGAWHGARRTGWLFPLALAGAWHWLWFMGLSPDVGRVLPVSRRYVPKVRFVGEAQGARRAALDPRVFHLPTEQGFSARSPAASEGPLFRVLLSGGSEAFLEREQHDADSLLVSSGAEWDPPRAESVRRFMATAREPAAYGTRATEVSGQPHLEFSQGLSSNMIAASLPVSADWASFGRAWQVTVFLEFGELGRVSHALIERPGEEAALNALVLRAARQWQAKPGTGSVRGRVTVRYVP